MKPDLVFEVSFEVCNKVGGIFTVVSSKAALMTQHYGDSYCLIGPYIQQQAKTCFISLPVPEEYKGIFDELGREGISCVFGKWDIKGDPRVILIDYKGYNYNRDAIKAELWNRFGIDSLEAAWDFNDTVVWGWAVGKLVEKFARKNRKILLHCHEWMAGFPILYLKTVNANIATVFTTHATMVGRAIAGAGGNLYSMLSYLNARDEAYKSGIQEKYLTELACAQNVDVFTTVSEITSIEAEKILGRKADVLLLNGLDIEKFPTIEETSIKHKENRLIFNKFVSYYFFPHYSFDTRESVYLFIVGRYEYKNKGLDIFTKALAELNKKLKETNAKQTVVAFFWIPRDTQGIKIGLSASKIGFDQLEDFFDKYSETIKSDTINAVMSLKMAEITQTAMLGKQVFRPEFLAEAKRLRLNFEKDAEPPLCTHNLQNEDNDDLIRGFRENGLLNKQDDKVKVVFYPVYLTGVDGLLNLPYYDAMMGCHLGVFPSYYEPWGYTPLECAALGVPSLTTDFGGFGRFLLQQGKGKDGIYVLKRFGRDDSAAIREFSDILFDFVTLEKKERVKLKVIAKEIAHLADWKTLIFNYIKAHQLALDKHGY